MPADLDFASLLTQYDDTTSYLHGKPFKAFVQHNAGIVNAVVGGSVIAPEEGLHFAELEQAMLAIVQRSREPHVAAPPGFTSLVAPMDEVRTPSTDLQVESPCPG